MAKNNKKPIIYFEWNLLIMPLPINEEKLTTNNLNHSIPINPDIFNELVNFLFMLLVNYEIKDHELIYELYSRYNQNSILEVPEKLAIKEFGKESLEILNEVILDAEYILAHLKIDPITYKNLRYPALAIVLLNSIYFLLNDKEIIVASPNKEIWPAVAIGNFNNIEEKDITVLRYVLKRCDKFIKSNSEIENSEKNDDTSSENNSSNASYRRLVQ